MMMHVIGLIALGMSEKVQSVGMLPGWAIAGWAALKQKGLADRGGFKHILTDADGLMIKVAA